MNWENKDFTRLADGVNQADIKSARDMVNLMPDSEDKIRLMKLVDNADRIYSESYFKVEEHKSELKNHIDSYSRSVERFAAIVEEHRVRT